MTVTNPELSPTESAQLRTLLVSVVVHVILGYSLYVVALLQTAPPLWALNAIEQLKPTLGALDTAARLSEHPFPAQVMILYAIPSSILLGMYWASYIFLVKRVRQDMYRRLCEQWRQTGLPFKLRLGFFGYGLAQLYACGYALPIRFFVEGGDRYRDYLNNWLSSALFSSSILSTTLLLLVSAVAGSACVLGPLSFYLSIRGFTPPHQ